MKFRNFLCLCLLCPIPASQAASVRTFTGETREGKASFDTDGITITPDQGPATKVDLANVLDSVFATRLDNSPQIVPPGVLLTNGSFIAGRVEDFEAPTVKVGSGGIVVPGSTLAQVLFLGVTRDKLPPPAAGRTGAMLNDGDFLAGTVDGMKEGRLQITSLVLGPQRLTPGNQCSGWVLRNAQIAPATYEVSSRDGSTYLTNALTMDHDGVSLVDSIAGNVRIKSDDLMEIRAGAGRYKALSDATPARIDVPAGASTANAFKVQPADPATPGSAPALLSAANAMVSYPVPPGLAVFSSGVALAKDAPATAHLAFDIYADGRLIFGSPIVAAGASPQPIRVDLGAARMITLRAEPSGPGSEGAIGEWIGPILLRP